MGAELDSDIYVTLDTSGEGCYKEKGSKFIGKAYHVNSIEEVNEHLNSLRKEYYDARHHCYAYRIGFAGEQYRANDDGEPNHSAGDPILGQIKSMELTFTLVVVVRYFGGTKLGVSGLIHAYKAAAAEALHEAQKIERLITRPLRLHYPYHRTQEVLRMIDDFQLSIVNQEFTDSCMATILIPRSKFDQIKSVAQKIQEVEVVETENA